MVYNFSDAAAGCHATKERWNRALGTLDSYIAQVAAELVDECDRAERQRRKEQEAKQRHADQTAKRDAAEAELRRQKTWGNRAEHDAPTG